jgi:hypothetical protein
MKLTLIILLLSTPILAQSAPTSSQLLGTWKLVSVEDTTQDGRVQPSSQFGLHPHGFLMYEPDGYMCATIVDGDRPPWKAPDHPTDAEKMAYYDTFIVYCGTYKLDSATSTVTHYPEVAWTPAYVGSTQPRPFRFEGNKLIITATKGFSDPNIKQRVLVWQRAKE